MLLIDEAHLLSHDQLEAIRMLTSAQLDSSSPLAVLLIGQPHLRASMKLGVLAALDQRIGVRYGGQGPAGRLGWGGGRLRGVAGRW